MDVIPEVIVPSPKEDKKKQEEKESIRDTYASNFRVKGMLIFLFKDPSCTSDGWDILFMCLPPLGNIIIR